MSASSSSGEKKAHLPDLVFPILEPAPTREGPTPPAAALQVIELSEAFLPVASARPDFEARRLELKTRVPFRLRDEDLIDENLLETDRRDEDLSAGESR